MLRPILIALALAPLPLCAAQVFKWVDADGVTHFGDLPPHHEAQRYNVKPIPASAPPPAAEEGEAKEPENPEAAEYCRRARDDLKRYETAERLMRLDEEGNEVDLDDAARAKLIERTQQRVDKWCK